MQPLRSGLVVIMGHDGGGVWALEEVSHNDLTYCKKKQTNQKQNRKKYI